MIKHQDRAEATRVTNFPYEAIEEAVVNAIYHRSYEEREPVEVRVSPQEMIILSYPGPDRSVRLDQLRIGRAIPRRYRNRRIGEFLKELDLTEGRATGIPKILRSMEENNSPPPEFEFDEDHSYFLVRLPAHPDVREEIGQETVKKTLPVTLPVIRLLEYLYSRGEKGSAEIRREFGLKDRINFRRLYIDPAMDSGLIEFTIPQKPNSRLQSYRLTEKGRSLLASRSVKKSVS